MGGMENSAYDVIVVGGGAAGLSGAIALARFRRSVLVLDTGDPRNTSAAGVHNLLGHDGKPPLELLARGRAELASYGGEVENAEAVSARLLTDERHGFEVTLADGRTVRSRRLLVTTGVHDELPEIEGVRERWGHDVLHCPYCHGWEVRDQAVGIIATASMAGHMAKMFRQLTDDVVLFRHTGPDLGEEEWEALAALGVQVVDGEVKRLVIEDNLITGVELAGGQVIPRQAVVVTALSTARSSVLESLGLKPVEQAMNGFVAGTVIEAGPTGATSVPGLFVAGNLVNVSAQVGASASGGMMAGAMLNMTLIEEDALALVAAR